MQRIFSSAGAGMRGCGRFRRLRAPGELKIGCAKPRAKEDAMGIECPGRGGDNRRAPSEVIVRGAHAFAGATFSRWWKSRCQQSSVRGPDGCRAPSSCFCKKQEFPVGLGKANEGTIGTSWGGAVS